MLGELGRLYGVRILLLKDEDFKFPRFHKLKDDIILLWIRDSLSQEGSRAFRELIHGVLYGSFSVPSNNGWRNTQTSLQSRHTYLF